MVLSPLREYLDLQNDLTPGSEVPEHNTPLSHSSYHQTQILWYRPLLDQQEL